MDVRVKATPFKFYLAIKALLGVRTFTPNLTCLLEAVLPSGLKVSNVLY